MNKLQRNQIPAAFTLIEILTVVAIIGVLAALLFPAIKGALQKAEIAQAQNDIKNIESAVKSFYVEYGKWPNGNGGTLDFSYGAFGNSGSYSPSHPAYESGSMSSGYCENHWLMETLQAIQDNSTLCGNGGTLTSPPTTPVNSRAIVFITIPAKSLKLSTDSNPPGTVYYDYVDPWGNPYQITVDANYDNICSNLANSVVTGAGTPVYASAAAPGCVSNSIAVWSFGPLGPYGNHTTPGPNNWITSWQ
ncbi:MAG: prepilin-type N-terminal cleavage/methylation domain-containing protein [Verrucomicrobiia bacterium]|jgi:prepilin-type N-terminal cleavage/methylation domain-containing protein